MSKNRMTTTGNFRVEDISFKNPRYQHEIEKELGVEEELEDVDLPVPVSLTPEQVKAFYMMKIVGAKDSNEKRLYAQTIKWIDELLECKKKLVSLEAKEVLRNTIEKENAEENIEE